MSRLFVARVITMILFVAVCACEETGPPPVGDAAAAATNSPDTGQRDGTGGSNGAGGASNGGDAQSGGHPNAVKDAGPDAGNVPPLASGRIAAGDDYTCVIRSDRTVQCWGKSYQATVPTGAFRQIAAGYRNACALRDDGSIACWHNRAASPQGEVDEKIPEGPFTLVRVGGARAGEFACGLRSSGEAVCWSNPRGTGVNPLIKPPVAARFVDLALGEQHGCGLTMEGNLACWASYPTSPILTVPPGMWSHLCAGAGFACAVSAPGVPRCWGLQLTWPSRWPTTAVARGLFCAASGPLACAIVGSGRAYCTDVDGPWSGAAAVESRFREVAVGTSHACGVRSQGDVQCWAGVADQDNEILNPPEGLVVGFE